MSGVENVKYIIDAAGHRQEVIIPFVAWKNLIDELELLREKHQILSGLRQACREAKKQQKGELPEQSLAEFLDEL